MSLAQIGEFSFIIASVGVAVGCGSQLVIPVAIGVSAITTLTTPLLIKLSNRARHRRPWLPAPIQTVAALYGSWIERVALTAGADRAIGDESDYPDNSLDGAFDHDRGDRRRCRDRQAQSILGNLTGMAADVFASWWC